jgi:AraC-like DNA-binding protein
MPKHIVKVVLSRQQHEILKEVARKLGISESETMRTALMEYAKSLSIITEYVHRPLNTNNAKT